MERLSFLKAAAADAAVATGGSRMPAGGYTVDGKALRFVLQAGFADPDPIRTTRGAVRSGARTVPWGAAKS